MIFHRSAAAEPNAKYIFEQGQVGVKADDCVEAPFCKREIVGLRKNRGDLRRHARPLDSLPVFLGLNPEVDGDLTHTPPADPGSERKLSSASKAVAGPRYQRSRKPPVRRHEPLRTASQPDRPLPGAPLIKEGFYRRTSTPHGF